MKKKTKTISIEIHPEMEMDFHFWLYVYKLRENPEALRRMINCISLESKEVDDLILLVETKRDIVDQKLRSVYDFLNSSPSLKSVAGNSYEVFIETSFVQKLTHLFYIMEVKEQLGWKGTEMKTKAALSLLSAGLHLLFTIIGEAIATGLSKNVNEINANKSEVAKKDDEVKDVIDVSYDSVSMESLDLETLRPTYDLFLGHAEILIRQMSEKEFIEWRNNICIYICESVDQFFPHLSLTSKNHVVGIFSAHLGFHSQELKHQLSGKVDSYKKALNTFVNNVRKSHARKIEK